MFWEYGYYENQEEQQLINRIEYEVMQFNRTYQKQYYNKEIERGIRNEKNDFNGNCGIKPIRICKDWKMREP